MKNVRLLESTLLGATEVFSSETTTPKTDSKSYKLAQKTLESEEEQFFTKKEINAIFPNHLKKKSSK
ncbi:TPA: hypothetical protein IUD81_002530 [Enterococcus faecalis]|nr:hypothetical protein [Enterococcus faecalis]